MALNIYEQIQSLLKDKKNILIVFDKDSKGDGIGSSIALALFLEKMGKKVDIVSADISIPNAYKFLEKSQVIEPKIGNLQNFIMTIDVEKQGLKELSYDIKENKLLRLFITPKSGYISKNDIQTSQTDFKYETIFVLDTPDLKSLGKLFFDNQAFFHQTPIINIDHKSANENFGQVNLLNLTASTTAEILYDFFKKTKAENITKEIATALLTSIISETKSFTIDNVKPHTFTTAGELIKLGADRSYIIKNLQQTKTIGTFKLWGQALSHLEHDAEYKIISTLLTIDDFKRTGTTEDDLPDIIDEIIIHSPSAEVIVILYEHRDEKNKTNTKGIVRIIPHFHAKEIMQDFSATGDQDTAKFILEETPLKQAQEKVLAHLKKTLNQK